MAELEQEELNKRLAGAEAAPVHSPAASVPAAAGTSSRFLSLRLNLSLTRFNPLSAKTPAQRIEEDEEEAELRELQAQLAM